LLRLGTHMCLNTNNICFETEAWFLKNELILNMAKTCVMSLHSSQCRHPYKPCICCCSSSSNNNNNNNNNNNISYCSAFKFVGMNVTENLNWHIHVRSLCGSLGKIYYIIKSLKDMRFCTVQMIYFAYFQMWMKYGIIFRGQG
jgi:hypothetical protein